jgi:hypothetical protein
LTESCDQFADRQLLLSLTILQDSRFGWKTLRGISPHQHGDADPDKDGQGNLAGVAIAQPCDRLMPFAAAPGFAVDSLADGSPYSRTELSID